MEMGYEWECDGDGMIMGIGLNGMGMRIVGWDGFRWEGMERYLMVLDGDGM